MLQLKISMVVLAFISTTFQFNIILKPNAKPFTLIINSSKRNDPFETNPFIIQKYKLELDIISKMPISNIIQELQEYKVSYKSIFDRIELNKLLAKTRLTKQLNEQIISEQNLKTRQNKAYAIINEMNRLSQYNINEIKQQLINNKIHFNSFSNEKQIRTTLALYNLLYLRNLRCVVSQ